MNQQETAKTSSPLNPFITTAIHGVVVSLLVSLAVLCFAFLVVAV